MVLTTIESRSASRRIAAARAFTDALPRHAEIAVVSASRGAADDFARGLAHARGATFGLYRFSFTQLAARLAAPRLARAGLAPTTALGAQAVAARALFDAWQDGSLSYFHQVASTPGFPRALARTLEELSLAAVPAASLRAIPGGGDDLAQLLDRFDEQFQAAAAVDRAAFLTAAADATRDPASPYAACHMLLLDVAITNPSERRLIEAVVARAPGAFATVPHGDAETRAVYVSLGSIQDIDPPDAGGLDRVRQYLFSAAVPPASEPLADVEVFSAPGEGREAVEIARRILKEARSGVPFDQMAILVRSPQQYAGLLEHALRRAGVPAYFDRGTKRPHPAGRAFLALLTCASEHLSARRFAEYLSLGQVPAAGASSDPADAFPVSSDDVFGALADRQTFAGTPGQPGGAGDNEGDPGNTGSAGSSPRSFRAPWKWETLLADSRVVASEERWPRRLNGLIQECHLQRRELQSSEPDSPRIDQLGRRIDDLAAFAAFALPVVRAMGAWPVRATWAEWLEHFEALTPRVLRQPEHVLRVLTDLRPMGVIGPIPIEEATRVLTDRLATMETEPPRHRYGAVFIGGPAQARGRSFDVVFVPALAERMFPQKPREDPLLLDQARGALAQARGHALTLTTQQDRAEFEKLQLKLAIGAAARRLYVSFPTVEIGEGRPRVPSLYMLELWRAMTGRVPGAGELQHVAARTSRATLAWPAPDDRNESIDSLEHDLATLRHLVAEPDHRARGRAQYILQLNASLQRSVRERYMRGKPAWSHWDGLTRVTDRTAPALAHHRLTTRAYSLSALQKYAVCPYQFLLGSIYKLRPAEDLEPLQRLDPLTRGSLFHAVQAVFYRRLQADGQQIVTAANRDRALETLDAAVLQIAGEYHERLAPAVERVWDDEIAGIRRDLRLWVDDISRSGGEWVPLWFEWSFGLTDGGRDPDSVPEPVAVDGRFRLRGSIDLVEQRAVTAELRVTDHKTGKYRGKDQMVVGGGAVLQPVLYGLVLEQATGRPVTEGRLYYATTAGGYRDVRIPLTPQNRRTGVEVLEVIDRAVETGFLAPAPAEKACAWCDFRPVCGPTAERRIGRYKSHDPLADLLELRRRP